MSLDTYVLLAIALFVLLGYAKGIIKMAFGLLSIVLAIILSRLFYPIISNFLMGSVLYEHIVSWVVNYMALSETVTEMSVSTGTDMLNSLPLPQSLVDMVAPLLDVTTFVDVSSVEQSIGGVFAALIVNLISMVIMFIAVMFAVRLIGAALNLVSKLPVLNMTNRLLGAGAGLILGIFVVWVGLIAFTVFFLPINTSYLEMLYDSTIALWFYERNPLLSMFVGMI